MSIDRTTNSIFTAPYVRGMERLGNLWYGRGVTWIEVFGNLIYGVLELIPIVNIVVYLFDKCMMQQQQPRIPPIRTTPPPSPKKETQSPTGSDDSFEFEPPKDNGLDTDKETIPTRSDQSVGVGEDVQRKGME